MTVAVVVVVVVRGHGEYGGGGEVISKNCRKCIRLVCQIDIIAP
jgi:hypothetical protein